MFDAPSVPANGISASPWKRPSKHHEHTNNDLARPASRLYCQREAQLVVEPGALVQEYRTHVRGYLPLVRVLGFDRGNGLAAGGLMIDPARDIVSAR